MSTKTTSSFKKLDKSTNGFHIGDLVVLQDGRKHFIVLVTKNNGDNFTGLIIYSDNTNIYRLFGHIVNGLYTSLFKLYRGSVTLISSQE